MNVALAKSETGRAVTSVFTVARERLPGSGKVADGEVRTANSAIGETRSVLSHVGQASRPAG